MLGFIECSLKLTIETFDEVMKADLWYTLSMGLHDMHFNGFIKVV